MNSHKQQQYKAIKFLYSAIDIMVDAGEKSSN